MVLIGSLLVDFNQRNVSQNGRPVRIGVRTFDVLDVLYRANGSILSKEKLMNAVWPGLAIEENRLRVHIAALRSLLGADRDLIKTVSGRGYILVVKSATAGEGCLQAESESPTGALPPVTSPLLGRDDEIEQVIAQIDRGPVTTVVGAGGIGKTALALHVAHKLHHRCGGSICFVELATTSSCEGVLAMIADALRLPLDGGQLRAEQLPDVLAAAGCLLVLDNAEHVIDPVATLVEAVAARNQPGSVLVTSREPLHIRAESVLRLEPLAVPDEGLSTEEILEHSAVQLFLTRARSLVTDCATDEMSITLVAEICRRLEGLPLAIELAAARVASFGIEGVASRMDQRLDLLTGGLRSALPQHQTLRATFNWSYTLLDPASRIIFRRLGCFNGRFTFDGVCAVATEPGMSISVVVSCLAELASKSLLNVELQGDIAKYRLTQSTRAYAIEKLCEEGEMHATASRHIQYTQKGIEDNGLVVSQDGCDGSDINTRLSLDDARAAFDWAFSKDGDSAQGVALAGALVGTLLDASLVCECCVRARRALEVLYALPDHSTDADCEMRLCAAYATTLLYVGDSIEPAMSLWQRVWKLAQSLGNEAFTLRALHGLWNITLATANIHTSIRYATRFQLAALRGGSRGKQLLAEAMFAVSLHSFGDHEQAKARLESVVRDLDHSSRVDVSCGALAIHPLVCCYGTLARIAWLQGNFAHAAEYIEMALAPIRRDMLEPSLSHLLATVAVPITLQCGDVQTASLYLALLRSQVATHRLDIWEDYARCLSVQIDVQTSDDATTLDRLEPALERLIARGFRRTIAPFIVLWAETLARAGRFTEAAAKLDDGIAFGETHGEQYFGPELLRARGAVEFQHARACDSIAQDDRAHHEAEGRRLLDAAIALAIEHTAVFWELRAVLDLATFLLERDEVSQAVSLLSTFDGRLDLSTWTPDSHRLAELRSRADEASIAHTGANRSQSAIHPGRNAQAACFADAARHPTDLRAAVAALSRERGVDCINSEAETSNTCVRKLRQ